MSLQEIKSEPSEDEVDGLHEELDISNIYFDYEDKIPIKEEIKLEIKTEPLDEDNPDVETPSCEVDQEKSDLQAMVDKLLIEKQTWQKDMEKLVELQVKNKILKSEKKYLQAELQNLKSEKFFVEKQLEDREKKS